MELEVHETTKLTTPENVSKAPEKEILLPDTDKWNAAIEYISDAENTEIAFQKIERKFEIAPDLKVQLVSEATDMVMYKQQNINDEQ